MARKKRVRDYKAEYQRRLARGKARGLSRAVSRGHARKGEFGIRASQFLDVRAGSLVKDSLFRDMRRVFGRRVRRTKEDIPSYELRLEEMAKRDGKFDWLNEARFIEQMKFLGLTEREAYSAFFGSPD